MIPDATDTGSVPGLAELLTKAAIPLPKQAILENFVHHNPWEMLQHMNFFEAQDYVEKEVLGALSPGARFKLGGILGGADPRLRPNAALAELTAVYLDKGGAKWTAAGRKKGFLVFFADLELMGGMLAPWRNSARVKAQWILQQSEQEIDSTQISEQILEENLAAFGVSSTLGSSPEDIVITLRALLFDMQGWSGMFQRLEDHPDEAPEGVRCNLIEYAAVLSILQRASMEDLCRGAGFEISGQEGCTLGDILKKKNAPHTRDAPGLKFEHESQQNPSGLAFIDQNSSRVADLERIFEITTLNAITRNIGKGKSTDAFAKRPTLQVYTCIDERECSFRRHLESAAHLYRGAPGERPVIETFGVPGFFDFAIRYRPANGMEECVLAPEGSRPPHTLVECTHCNHIEQTKTWHAMRKLFAQLETLWENLSFSPVGVLCTAVLGMPVSIVYLIFLCFFPTVFRRMKTGIVDKVFPEPRHAMESPFTPEECAARLAKTFNNIGTKQEHRFSQVIIVLGHGSRTVNNPFDAAHNCGACGGREGGPNARLIAKAANTPTVREILQKEYGVVIPTDTWFVGGYHDTSSELVELFDTEDVPEHLQTQFQKAKEVIYEARGQNALERCSRFLLAAGSVKTPEDALTHVATKSTDLGDARPELGHATNGAVIVGPRRLTRGLFLARRPFMMSYDSSNDDDRGSNLENVIAPALVVCSGISLEYLFSTCEGGAGTKVAMNIVGMLGVQQGVHGDLLPGLPTQMTEMHSPLRALYLVDSPVSRVKAVLARRKALRDIVENDWIRFFVRDPDTGIIYHQSQGEYIEHTHPVHEASAERFQKSEPQSFVPYTHHLEYALSKKHQERLVYCGVIIGMILSACLPIKIFGNNMLNSKGLHIALAGTGLALCVTHFARRYLHGEFMFDRFMLLSFLMLLGFNLVATAPDLATALGGWTGMGFASAFSTGAFNFEERPSVRDNAAFVFCVYQMSDCFLLVAAALHGIDTDSYATVVAVSLVVAALLKTSQFPVGALFSRSMESPSPISALGSGALSAHLGVVLLSGTQDIWMKSALARALLLGTGLLTCVTTGLAAQVRPDRKGGIGMMCAATVGLLYVLLALGYTNTVLLISLGHSPLRTIQLLKSHNILLEFHSLNAKLGHREHPPNGQSNQSNWLFCIAWRCNRFYSDLQLPHVLHRLRRLMDCLPSTGSCASTALKTGFRSMKLTKLRQWVATLAVVVLAGCPYTPFASAKDVALEELLQSEHFLIASAFILLYVALSTALIWCLLSSVLDLRRFRHEERNHACLGLTAVFEARTTHDGLYRSLIGD